MADESQSPNPSRWEVDDELLAVFHDEVADQLAELTELLEKHPSRWRLDELFRIAHNVKGGARLVAAEAVREVAHRLEDLFSVLRDQEGVLDRSLVALAREGSVLLSSVFERAGRDAAAADEAEILDFCDRVGERLEAGSTTENAGAMAPDLGPGGPEEEPGTEDELGANLAIEPPGADSPPAGGVRGGATLRVPVARLDQLLALGTDVVSQDARVRLAREQARDLCLELDRLESQWPEIRRATGWRQLRGRCRGLRSSLFLLANEQERLSKGLRASTFGLRMLPVAALRSVLALVVREASGHYGRTVRFDIEGGDTELDRDVLDALRDPLVHLARNAVAHGLESAPARRQAGKAESGSIVLRARSEGSWVALELADDGRGLDLPALRKEARRRGLPVPESLTTQGGSLDPLLHRAIFSPGFTTATQVDDVAGRGVGLDIVRKAVEGLGGELTVATCSGLGTSFRLRVPASRLTTDGLAVRAGGRLLVLPAGATERAVLVAPSDVKRVEGRRCIQLAGDESRDQRIDIQPLEEILGLPTQEAPTSKAGGQGSPAVILTDGYRRKAIAVDEVIGRVEIVVQPLPWNLRGLYAVAACTVLHGEEAVPVLDAAALVSVAVSSRSAASDPDGDRRRRILVADDSVTSRTLESNILSNAGFETLVAVDGQEAWELLQKHDIDLLVSDVDMPRLSGLELTRKVRADKKLEHLPVVLVTSLTGDLRRQGAEAGADAYIVKGEFDQDELLEAVGRLL